MLSYLRAVAHRNRENRESGASAVEYGLMVAAIAAVIVVVVFALGGVVKNTFGDTCRTIDGQGNTAGGAVVPKGCEAP
jgi:pilus assembly protein Flp/PilA